MTAPTAPDLAARWLALLRDLTIATPSWGVWKNADAAMIGDGDIDSSAPMAEFTAITDVFAEWARQQELGPVVVCRHIPRVMFLAALDPDRPTFYELDVLGRKYFRGAPFFVAEQLVPMMEQDARGFRRVRPGVEGVILLVQNGAHRGGAANTEGLARRGVRTLLTADPDGVRQAATLFGSAAGAALDLADAVVAGNWDRRAMQHLELHAVAKAVAAPTVPLGRLRLRLWTKRRCPLLRSVFFADRALPYDRRGWLQEVARTHLVLGVGGS
jgi:hypothetical protein